MRRKQLTVPQIKKLPEHSPIYVRHRRSNQWQRATTLKQNDHYLNEHRLGIIHIHDDGARTVDSISYSEIDRKDYLVERDIANSQIFITED